MLNKILKPYRALEKPVVNMIIAEFFIQMVNASMMMVLNIYLAKKGYTDPEIADFISWRFLSVMLLAFPLGLFIKGRKIIPFFYVASIGVSLFSLGILLSVEFQHPLLVHISLAFWGVCYAFMQVLALPFILRNTSSNNQSAAISLSYSTYSFAMIASGTLIYLLNFFNPELFHEYQSLFLISSLSIISVYFVWRW